ncbi:hypothetical protein BGL52_05630 [Lacticaseibacillus casei]|uniref:Uncharacterized protein n=1 Tax=Lacticaseibacillus casei TaxID=1582 RepID=A0AAN1C7I8_LACCA|nr:hypothetical protein BGL52_05630 [Lacticaseibacillus casei]
MNTQKSLKNGDRNARLTLAIQPKFSHEHLQPNFEASFLNYFKTHKPSRLQPRIQFLRHILIPGTTEQCEHVLLVVICLSTDFIGFQIAGVKAKIALYQFLRFHNFGFTSPQLHHELLIFILLHK